uniref:Putative tick transposon n=1 Tax=Rhipicephalus pulchellus TaxID=72859 RepID=L7LZZ1_RHIPC
MLFISGTLRWYHGFLRVVLLRWLGAFLWDGKTPKIHQKFLKLSKCCGGLSLPDVPTFTKALAAKTVCKLFQGNDYPGRSLLLYWTGTIRTAFTSERYGGPQAEHPHAFYKTAAGLKHSVDGDAPEDCFAKLAPARISEMLMSRSITDEEEQSWRPNKWKRWRNNRMPEVLTEFHWLRRWYALPTRQRLSRWGVVPNDRCPNCGNRETIHHTMFECVVAKGVWHVVWRQFGVSVCSLGQRRRGLFEQLVFSVTMFVLWRRRCLAKARRKPQRAAYPALQKIRMIMVRYLTEQIETQGDEAFLTRWHPRFFGVRKGNIEFPLLPF